MVTDNRVVKAGGRGRGVGGEQARRGYWGKGTYVILAAIKILKF